MVDQASRLSWLLMIAMVAHAQSAPPPSTAARDLPRRSLDGPNLVLWAWERPEDLRTLDPHRYAVAYLDRTITLGREVNVVPRLQPIGFAPGVRVMAVVRIQAAAPGPIDLALLDRTADAIISSASKSFVGALQIDFDATVSQRPFYRELLLRVRQRIRPGMPLSMTALASWCSFDDWIRDLPVDEAVPMFFRMTPSIHRIGSGWRYPIREPLCSTSAGVSTDEGWPELSPGIRLYFFTPRAWDAQSLAILTSRVHP